VKEFIGWRCHYDNTTSATISKYLLNKIRVINVGSDTDDVIINSIKYLENKNNEVSALLSLLSLSHHHYYSYYYRL